MKRATFDPARDVGHEQPEAPRLMSRNCAAHGCSLSGDGADAPGGPYFCSWHRSFTSDLWPHVTASLRRHEQVVRVIVEGQGLLNRQPLRVDLHAQFFASNREALEHLGYHPEPARRPNWDNLDAWLYRVRSMLSQLLRDEVGSIQQRMRQSRSRSITEGAQA